jgi:signal transduction histidine kinase
LLEVSRLESGEAKLYLQPTDLAQVINIILREKATVIRKKNIQVSLNVEQEPFPFVYTEPNRIKQAFSNIVQNSITYSNAHSKIGISLRVKDNSALVEIKDTGVGIPKLEQGRLFSKFYRGSNILQFETTGTGLGMYITRAFIEASGGGIWFDSKQDKGTSIYFTLPIAK